MYLKSIEMHGFKSFANKIVLEFHNGITCIVGPNGSGKSNVADAVRWVLGEQSARQLRGASMQDVIFSGTENRKPLSYAYVAITMDNSDHLLPIEYEEVTIARRVYRSGESEYLLNGSPCRLKDVNELFYDTGIGKEGYSIIGQGQIERILSGKPEERRELFDEAVGIVKFKKRKIAACKKLDEESENLLRLNDILSELEHQIGPLEKQAEIARLYLKKKDELKNLDVNAFLMEVEHLNEELSKLAKASSIATHQLEEAHVSDEQIKKEYNSLSEQLNEMDAKIESIRAQESQTTVAKGKLENQISLLEEQIRSAESSDDSLAARIAEIEIDKEALDQQKQELMTEKSQLIELLEEVVLRLDKANAYYKELEDEIFCCNEGIKRDKNEIMEILGNRGNIKSKDQRLKTMLEQINIRKAKLNQRLLSRKTLENQLNSEVSAAQTQFDEMNIKLQKLRLDEEKLKSEKLTWMEKQQKAAFSLRDKENQRTKLSSDYEALRNIAERYDGYGNSIRKVMDKKSEVAGICGVISELFHVDKEYETAIETALGGNIQNIVTKDEQTAKEMISFLKKNHFGRATFLPLTSVHGRGLKNQDVLSEQGVIGLASELITCDSLYKEVASYLLGRVVVTKNIDAALSLAKKNHFSLHIVTLDGEYLSPGGSMTGGAFKNSSNLLGRHREMEEYQNKMMVLDQEISSLKQRLDEIDTARSLLEDDIVEHTNKLQEAGLSMHTAKMNLEHATEQKEESEKAYASLTDENVEMERQMKEIHFEQDAIAKEMDASLKREEELNVEIENFQNSLDEKTYMETSANRNLSEVQIEESSARQKVTFVDENINRILGEIQKKDHSIEELIEQSKEAKGDVNKKKSDIEEIKFTISSADGTYRKLEEEYHQAVRDKEEMSANYSKFFEEKEKILATISDLEKELLRLEGKREKASEALNYQTNYMWDEYELTLHAAYELRDESFSSLDKMRKQISGVKDEIRRMGNVNVNAIEDYKEVSERYTFLKTQHDDLVEAKERLISLIDELDTGMRTQFTKGFADIQREFDKAFKELFGGGKGSLELVEDEDILECGIRIIAQPPGKKLQNMMQLSGGEKSLTAIALLFAIQNLKPSPFCLLDEIEAALDDSNVTRFAKYLHKLTKNTQFIIITHRRGTMNSADRLYGITMQEKGISTLVSVNLIENDLAQ